MPARFLWIVLAFLVPYTCVAEQWPSANILTRVLYVKVGTQAGSAFTIERNDKQYLITARHIVKDLPSKNATILIYRNKTWEPLTGDLYFPNEESIDIALMPLTAPITETFPIEAGGQVTLGENGYFLGFPWGLSTDASGYFIAFVKHISMSAIVRGQDPMTTVYYLDGFNNPGFSGGPVVFYNYETSKWKVIAVVSGFRPEQAYKRVKDSYVGTDTLVNSGIVIAYPLARALEVIDRIGK